MAQVGLLEDNTRIAKLCATMLQYVGHQVTVYEHPRTCLDALLAQPVMRDGRQGGQGQRTAVSGDLPIDVLILDLYLPDITGIEVVNALHSHPHTKSMPLVLCTAAAHSEVMRALRVAPHAYFLEKPFTFQMLTSTITTALNAQAR